MWAFPSIMERTQDQAAWKGRWSRLLHTLVATGCTVELDTDSDLSWREGQVGVESAALGGVCCFLVGSVQFSRSVVSDSLWPHEPQHTRPPCPSLTPGVYPNPCPSSRWCHPATSSSVPFSSCPQSLPASGSFPMSQLFAWGGKSTGVSASASVLPMNTQDSSPLGWTGWISVQSKGLSRVFSNTTVQKHQFLVLSFLHSPTLTSIHDYWKNHSLY